jgi:hypothetical protein
MDKLKELKINYNKLLQREKKAEGYLNKATDKQLESWLPEFIKITVDLSKMMWQFKDLAGREMTIEESLEGFKL